MRVTLVSPMAYPALAATGDPVAGGAEFQLITLGRALRDRGHEVSFVVADYGQPDFSEAEGFALHKAFRLFSGNRKLMFLPDMWRLRRAIHRSAPEVVNQRATAFYTAQCCHFSHEVDAAFVFTLGLDANCYPDLKQRVPGVIRGAYHWGIRRAEMVVAQTQSQAQLFARHFRRPAELLPNMLELPPPRSLAAPGDYVLWVGSLGRRKRPELFVDLAARLPHLRFKLVGGPGAEPGYDAAIRERARGVTNLEFAGFIPPQHMDAVYGAARVYVLTSRPDMEGLSNSFLQACAHGVPTVTVSVDPDGVIADKGLGAVSGEDGDLAPHVERLATDDDAFARASAAARRHVVENHDVVSLASRAESLLAAALRARRR